jgi:hypothetical protein
VFTAAPNQPYTGMATPPWATGLSMGPPAVTMLMQPPPLEARCTRETLEDHKKLSDFLTQKQALFQNQYNLVKI